VRGSRDEGRTRLAACATGQVTGDGWRKVRLGEIADCTLGKMLDHKKNHGTPRPYLANYNVRWGSFDLSDVSLMPFEDAELEKYRLEKGDLVVCEGGEIGRCALWRDDNLEMFIQKAIHRVRVHTDVCSSAYLYYWFLNSGRSDYFKQFTTGATILHLPRQNLIGIPVDLPPLPIQWKIAEILGAYDDLIGNNRRRIALLEKIARELYRERFVRRAGKFQQVRLGSLIDVCYGKDHKALAEGEIPVYGSGGVMLYADQPLYSGEAVLIPRKGTLNNIMYVNGDFWTVDTMFYAKPKQEAIAPFVYYYLSSIDMSLLNSGTAVPSMTTEVLNSMSVEVPSADELKSFAETFSLMFIEKEALVSQNRNLARQRDRLLPRLLSGRLEVRG